MSGEVLVWDARNFVPVYATYNRVHTSAVVASTNNTDGGIIGGCWKSSVAPVRCTDLPKTPEGCPHGCALLAMGLGGRDSGGGVVRLCDAFRGVDATHELTTTDGGDGAINAVAWDPCHPFRLASGDEHGAVRLWDVRKAGNAACLGVLDRDGDGTSRVSSAQLGFSVDASRRRPRGAGSHSGPVTALTFAPDGDDLVSSGLDGKIRHWDLRPRSCFVSSMAAICEGGKGRFGDGGNMDPSVAIGGRLLPTRFAGERGSRLPTGVATGQTQMRRRRPRHHLAIIQPGSRTTATLFSTVNDGTNSSRGQITGYSLFGCRGKEPGGCPSFILSGHLADISCIVPIVDTWYSMSTGNRRNAATMNHVNFLTGGMDGMILSWGGSHKRRIDARGDMHDGGFERKSFRGHLGNRKHSPSTHEESPNFEDVDTW